MSGIPDFSEAELDIVRDLLSLRYGKAIEPDLAEVEMRIASGDRELTPCPTVYWEQRGCHFVVCKTGASAWRNQFFYSAREQYGTGIEEYTDLAECVNTLLRLQADHDSQRSGAYPTGQ